METSEQHYRAIAQNFPNGGIFLFDLEMHFLVARGKRLTEMGLTPEHLEGKTIREVLPEVYDTLEPLCRAALAGQSTVCDMDVAGRSYNTHLVPVQNDQGRIVAGLMMMQDITARRRDERLLHATRELLDTVLEHIPVPVYVASTDQQIQLVNRAWEQTFHLSRDRVQCCTKKMQTLSVQQQSAADHPVIETEQTLTFEETVDTGQGLRHFQTTRFPLPMQEGVSDAVGCISIDITELLRTRQRVQRQYDLQAALRAVDAAIIGSKGLSQTLNVLLNEALGVLKVDAADILTLSPDTQTLELAARHGLKSNAVAHVAVQLGEGVVGAAVGEGRALRMTEARRLWSRFERAELMEVEGFSAYYALPLIAMGQVRGLLEIYNRKALPQDDDWQDFLEAITRQAALAIDNAYLLQRLQRSNQEMVQAYDTTIEGWSRALDLRDKETEGHSRRVTDLALQLAHLIGLSESELANVRRGALLHDIGKMGIPDSVLLKPGPLTDEEWEVMRRHPEFAYQMLYPIPFIRPALDIPCCHHEKWDGSGYPYGIQGEEIPLSARIFAVVDVYDALRSDRPYRAAWPEPQVRDYIRSHAGAHFDPDVAETFLRMLEKMETSQSKEIRNKDMETRPPPPKK